MSIDLRVCAWENILGAEKNPDARRIPGLCIDSYRGVKSVQVMMMEFLRKYAEGQERAGWSDCIKLKKKAMISLPETGLRRLF